MSWMTSTPSPNIYSNMALNFLQLVDEVETRMQDLKNFKKLTENKPGNSETVSPITTKQLKEIVDDKNESPTKTELPKSSKKRPCTEVAKKVCRQKTENKKMESDETFEKKTKKVGDSSKADFAIAWQEATEASSTDETPFFMLPNILKKLEKSGKREKGFIKLRKEREETPLTNLQKNFSKIEITKKQTGSNKSAGKLADKEFAVEKEEKEHVEKEQKEDVTKKQPGFSKFAEKCAEKKEAAETGGIIDLSLTSDEEGDDNTDWFDWLENC